MVVEHPPDHDVRLWPKHYLDLEERRKALLGGRANLFMADAPVFKNQWFRLSAHETRTVLSAASDITQPA